MTIGEGEMSEVPSNHHQGCTQDVHAKPQPERLRCWNPGWTHLAWLLAHLLFSLFFIHLCEYTPSSL